MCKVTLTQDSHFNWKDMQTMYKSPALLLGISVSLWGKSELESRGMLAASCQRSFKMPISVWSIKREGRFSFKYPHMQGAFLLVPQMAMYC